MYLHSYNVFMLKIHQRLKKERDIQSVYKKGKGVFDAVSGIKVQKNDLDFSRFGFALGTKVSKGAVDRNKIKRQYREIVRLHLEELKEGVDVLIIVSQKAMPMTFAEKEERLLKVFKKAGLLK